MLSAFGSEICDCTYFVSNVAKFRFNEIAVKKNIMIWFGDVIYCDTYIIILNIGTKYLIFNYHILRSIIFNNYILLIIIFNYMDVGYFCWMDYR